MNRSSRHYHGLHLALIVVCLSLSAAAAQAADASSPPFRPALPGYNYRFPFDHGTHDDFRTEWWYYTGHLKAENGQRFGYQITFFRRGVDPQKVRDNPSQWTIRHLYLAHIALSDLDGSRFHYAEKISRAGLGKAGADAGRLHVWIDRWTAEASPSPHEHYRLTGAGEDFSLDLVVTPEKSLVIHGTKGISRKGEQTGEASHYYSMTRLATTGTVIVNGEPIPVTGLSWMDHEFGSGDLGDDFEGWDWFSLQLDDRTEVMLYRLRRSDGSISPVSSGTVIFPDGRTRHLAATDVQVEILDHWHSPASDTRYPSRWHLTVPALSLRVELRPLLADQELITSRSTKITYWEGAVEALDMQRNAVVGHGYIELTGYAKVSAP